MDEREHADATVETWMPLNSSVRAELRMEPISRKSMGCMRSFLSPALGWREGLARRSWMLEPAGSCSYRKAYLFCLSKISLCQHYAGCQRVGVRLGSEVGSS